MRFAAFEIVVGFDAKRLCGSYCEAVEMFGVTRYTASGAEELGRWNLRSRQSFLNCLADTTARDREHGVRGLPHWEAEEVQDCGVLVAARPRDRGSGSGTLFE